MNLLRRLREFAEKAMPYTLTVHAYSNLVLDAILNQDGFAPGARINLEARLWEYKLPLRGAAKVWAEVRDPSGAQSVLGFSSAGGGAHTATFVTSRSGVYELAIHAEGRTSANAKFSRHKILTAGVWAGGDEPYDPKVDRPEGSGQCAWILCILETVEKSRELQARLKELGLDLGALRKCLEQHCNGAKAAMTLEKTERTTSEVLQALTQLPEFRQLMETVAPPTNLGAPGVEAAKTVPVKRQPKKPANPPENMFVRPEEMAEIEERRRRRKNWRKPKGGESGRSGSE